MLNTMNGVRHSMKSYVKDENAIDDGVTKIIFIVLAVIVVMGIGWYVWNLIANKADTATKQSDGSSNPGKGGEFNGNPFGN